MLEHGFIKLHRTLTEWRWYDDANTVRLYIHLLLTVNYETQFWHDISIERGQRLTTYETLANELKLSIKNIRTSLGKLKSTKDIQCSDKKTQGTLISICNYDEMQQRFSEKGHDFNTHEAVDSQAFAESASAQSGSQAAEYRQLSGTFPAFKWQQCKKEKEYKRNIRSARNARDAHNEPSYDLNEFIQSQRKRLHSQIEKQNTDSLTDSLIE